MPDRRAGPSASAACRRVEARSGRAAVAPALALALALAFGLATRVGAAQTERPTRRVQVVLAASDADAAPLEEVVRELCDRLGVGVEFVRAPNVDPRAIVAVTPTPASAQAPSPWLGRAWIDLRASPDAVLYVTDASAERVLVRPVPWSVGREELVREELGHILETAVETLLAGGHIGVARAEATRVLGLAPAPAPVPAPRREVTAWFALGVHYEAQVFAGTVPIVHGPGLSAGVGLARRTVRLGVAVVAAYHVPVIASPDPIGARWDTVTLRALATLGVDVAARLRLRAGLGAGADLTYVTPTSTGAANIELDPARLVQTFIARASVGLQVRLAGEFWAFADAVVDVDPSGTRYVVVDGGATTAVSSASPVRPALLLGLTFR